MPKFIHLHLHSEYSIVDGICRIKSLVNKAVEQNIPALAITDENNLFALVKFYKAAMGAGIKPIIGTDLLIENKENKSAPFRQLFLVQNKTGYLNLTRLISRAYQEGQYLGVAMIKTAWLNAESCAGLITLSGLQSELGQTLLTQDQEKIDQQVDFWLALFADRFYLELTRTARPQEEQYLHLAIALATAKNIPVVATNDVRFLESTDFDAHEIRVCIHQGRTLDDSKRPKLYSNQQFFRSEAEMCALFADIPEALANSVEIAKRCNIELTLGENYLPQFPIPEGLTEAQYFSQLSEKGLNERLEKILGDKAQDPKARQIYDERLKIELDVINGMGFPGYFLIVADFIQWAKDNQIPVGPGRGSGAGSLVAYALKITDLDPIEHDLLFERFLNPERVSMPDFDIDFCMDGRDRVIDYVARTYGRDAVSQIITYGSMAAKAVVRDVGRVLGHPYGFNDRISKAIPFEIGMTLKKALLESEDLAEMVAKNEEVRDLIAMAKQLEGITRNVGKHAGGVVISPTVLTDFSPLYCEEGGKNLITQFDKNDVEAVGLVKFDFLGLRTLTIVDWALQTVNAKRKKENKPAIDIADIPMNEPKSIALLKRCETTAVFQLESRGMKDLIKKLQPDDFEDITALVALFRPGPLGSGMVDDFIARKHGQQEVVYDHPDLEPILKPTYGVILYQEQVMQIAQVLAGYSLGGADLLRRAMGKKKPEEMKKQGDIFVKGAVERGVDKKVAQHIFDLMEKFAGYGFNKSHSAAYALVSYQTLWLKTHYPAEFMAAVLSADMDNTDKVVFLIEDCRMMGLEVVAPNLNISQYQFTVNENQEIVYGLGAIKGAGEAAIEVLIAERDKNGHYRDVFDFCCRNDLRKVNKRVLEALVRSGAMDCFNETRASLFQCLPIALKMAQQYQANQNSGQGDLFSMLEPVSTKPDPKIIPPALVEWDDEARLHAEKETLGLYLTGHPIDSYADEMQHIASTRIADIAVDRPAADAKYRSKGIPVTIMGLVMAVNQRNTQRGRMASVLLDDRSGRVDAVLFSDTYDEYRELLINEKILVVKGSASYDEYRDGVSLKVDTVLDIEDARGVYAKTLYIQASIDDLKHQNLDEHNLSQKLATILKPYQGGNCPIRFYFKQAKFKGLIQFGTEWNIEPKNECLRQLKLFLGEEAVKIVY